MSKVKHRLYLHSSKESNYEEAGELGITGEAARAFSYSLCEIAFDCLVDTETGEIQILSIDAMDGGEQFTRKKST